MTNLKLPEMSFVGREHWSDEDRQHEAEHVRRTSACHARRAAAMEARGWSFFIRRSVEEDGCAVRSWAIDPTSEKEVLASEAFLLQEEREPGSVEPFPAREFEPPSSSRLLRIEGLQRKPMKAGTGSVFYMQAPFPKDDEGEF